MELTPLWGHASIKLDWNSDCTCYDSEKSLYQSVLSEKFRKGVEMLRIIAGILMLIGAILGIIMIRAIYGSIPGLLGWLTWSWAILVFLGGVSTLKRVSWPTCLLASILLLPAGTVLPVLIWQDALSTGMPITSLSVVITLCFVLLGILPVVFIYTRKKEW